MISGGKACRSSAGGAILVVTEADLYEEGLNFIFGLAMGNREVISLRRLHPEFYGRTPRGLRVS
jgi:archaemetzincin